MGKITGVSRIPGWPFEPQTPDPDVVTSSLVKPTTVQIEKLENKEEALTAFGASGAAYITYALSSAAVETVADSIISPSLTVNLTPDTGQPIVEGTVLFSLGNALIFDRNGLLYRDINTSTGVGIQCGTVNYATGEAVIENYTAGSDIRSVALHSLVTRVSAQAITEAHFRTPGAPIRPGSFSVVGTLLDGTPFNATADFSGQIMGDFMQGGIDVETGIVNLYFGGTVDPAGHEAEEWYDVANIRPDGKMWVPYPVSAESITYSCVVYSYLPVDVNLVGIDPVRLPTDGRVPVFNKGGVVVVHHSLTDILPSGLTSGQSVNLSRDDLSLVELYDDSDVLVPSAGKYSVDLDTGIITMESPLDLSGYNQPLVAMHRREDMVQVIDVQINGQLAVAPKLTHDYPKGDTFVSSALLIGDMWARITKLFDQKTYSVDWADELIGDPCLANYDSVNYPITVTNKGAIDERWMIKFTSSTEFDVIGENMGVIAVGATNVDTQPLNPATGVPYFTIDKEGWGAGWATGNIIRFNTPSATDPVWFCRTTIASGEPAESSDQFTVHIRGAGN